jgi:hypothetical protein
MRMEETCNAIQQSSEELRLQEEKCTSLGRERRMNTEE